MSNNTPLFTKEHLEYLEKMYPERNSVCTYGNTEMAFIMGQRSVVNYIKQLANVEVRYVTKQPLSGKLSR